MNSNLDNSLAGDELTAVLADNAFCAEWCAKAIHDVIARFASLFENRLTNPVRMDDHADVDPCAFLITDLSPVFAVSAWEAEECVNAAHDILEASELTTFVIVHRSFMVLSKSDYFFFYIENTACQIFPSWFYVNTFCLSTRQASFDQIILIVHKIFRWGIFYENFLWMMEFYLEFPKYPSCWDQAFNLIFNHLQWPRWLRSSKFLNWAFSIHCDKFGKSLNERNVL